jgi:hypothetical protein
MDFAMGKSGFKSTELFLQISLKANVQVLLEVGDGRKHIGL